MLRDSRKKFFGSVSGGNVFGIPELVQSQNIPILIEPQLVLCIIETPESIASMAACVVESALM